MIPTVFISSTVDDLRHIRDAVRVSAGSDPCDTVPVTH